MPDLPCELLWSKLAGNATLSADRSVRNGADDALRLDTAALSSWVSARGYNFLIILVPYANAFEVRFSLVLIKVLERTSVLVIQLLRPEDIGSLDATERVLVRHATAAGDL